MDTSDSDITGLLTGNLRISPKRFTAKEWVKGLAFALKTLGPGLQYVDGYTTIGKAINADGSRTTSFEIIKTDDEALSLGEGLSKKTRFHPLHEKESDHAGNRKDSDLLITIPDGKWVIWNASYALAAERGPNNSKIWVATESKFSFLTDEEVEEILATNDNGEQLGYLMLHRIANLHLHAITKWKQKMQEMRGAQAKIRRVIEQIGN